MISVISSLCSIRKSTPPKPKKENRAETQLAHVAELNSVDREAEMKPAKPELVIFLANKIGFLHAYICIEKIVATAIDNRALKVSSSGAVAAKKNEYVFPGIIKTGTET